MCRTRPGERRARDPLEPGPRCRRSPCRRGRARRTAPRVPRREQPLVRVEQGADVLARLERAEEQHVAVAGGGVARRPGGRAGRADGDAIGAARRAARSTSPAVNCDGTMIAIGPVRVVARQRRVVAADFGARALGMRQEVQIVNRDDLGGRRATAAAADASECVTSNRAAGERFGRRPAEPMPREVQQPRPARGDRRSRAPRSSACTAQPILPRAREERQRRAARWPRPADTRPSSARDELVRVLADAAALAQRRPIVDQDAHLFKSFRLSILL